MANILVLEDDKTFAQILQGFLERQGHTTVLTHTVKEGLQQMSQNTFDLLLLDYRLPDGTGLDALAAAKENGKMVPAIMMTSYNDVRTAVKAMRSGVYDYITKPVNHEEFVLVVKEALQKKEAKQKMPSITPKGSFVQGQDEISTRLYEHIQMVAPTGMSVLIQGESGTGKEHVARAIHQQSKRAHMPFVAIDCGALSSDLAASELFGHVKGAFTGALTDKVGQFEYASGGTLFLDETGNLGYDIQVKLLRVLQEKQIQPVGSNKPVSVDVRILSATNDDLLGSVRKGSFREDLYHRLNEFKIQVPPLRMRRHDLQLFIRHFIHEANADLDKQVEELSPDIMDIFMNYEWPGNLRELKNVIRRMVLLSPGKIAGKDALPEEMLDTIQWQQELNTPDLKANQQKTEKELIMQTLEQVKYNKSRAARLLNIDRKTLYSKMDRYGIEG